MNIEHRTSNTEHRTPNIEHRAFNAQHSTPNVDVRGKTRNGVQGRARGVPGNSTTECSRGAVRGRRPGRHNRPPCVRTTVNVGGVTERMDDGTMDDGMKKEEEEGGQQWPAPTRIRLLSLKVIRGVWCGGDVLRGSCRGGSPHPPCAYAAAAVHRRG